MESHPEQEGHCSVSSLQSGILLFVNIGKKGETAACQVFFLLLLGGLYTGSIENVDLRKIKKRWRVMAIDPCGIIASGGPPAAICR